MIIKKSPCKINLFLDIKSKREDGYHLIESLFHTIDLFDIIKIEEDKEFKISTNGKYKLNDNEENIVSKIFYYRKKYSNGSGTRRRLFKCGYYNKLFFRRIKYKA